jgi:hypothetical protein
VNDIETLFQREQQILAEAKRSIQITSAGSGGVIISEPYIPRADVLSVAQRDGPLALQPERAGLFEDGMLKPELFCTGCAL